jgi:hypothetical protein
MKKFTILGLTILAIALIFTASCSCDNGEETKPPPSSSGGSGTQSFDGGRITFGGTKEQLNKIDDVEVIRPGDARYPRPDQISSGIAKILIVFEIKLKPGQGSVAPPPLTLDDFEMDRNDWDDVTPRDKRLPIYREVSSSNWTRAGEAWLKTIRPHAQGVIDHASLLAVVEEGEPTAPLTEPPPRSREQVIEEGVMLVVERNAPEEVWISLGSRDAPFVEAAELTRAYFEEFGVATEEVPEILNVLPVSVAAGAPPDVIVLFFPREQAREILARMDEAGYDGPVYGYSEESGEPEWWVVR